MLHQSIQTPDLFTGLEPASLSDDVLLGLLPRLLRYEPDTGKLYWLDRPVEMFKASSFRHRTGKIAVRPAQWSCNKWNKRFAGKEAFSTKHGNGYRCGTILWQDLLAHRVIWALEYGAWPDEEIDHINGNRTDNRLSNLRAVSHQENCRNAARLKNNTSGATGVSWISQTRKWSATITVDHRKVMLGCFEDFGAAVAARKQAERNHGFHPNHGRDQTRSSKADAEISA